MPNVPTKVADLIYGSRYGSIIYNCDSTAVHVLLAVFRRARYKLQIHKYLVEADEDFQWWVKRKYLCKIVFCITLCTMTKYGSIATICISAIYQHMRSIFTGGALPRPHGCFHFNGRTARMLVNSDAREKTEAGWVGFLRLCGRSF